VDYDKRNMKKLGKKRKIGKQEIDSVCITAVELLEESKGFIFAESEAVVFVSEIKKQH
jgi:hypothetical protein